MKFIILLGLIVAELAPALAAETKIDFWKSQRKGANFFNEVETAERFVAAKTIGIELVRLAPNKWKTRSRDFLIGDADRYTGLVEEDYRQLETTLNIADSVGVKVVLTMLSLPGCRWRQQNGDKDDDRLWRDRDYHLQVEDFWRALASRLKGHPSIVGYNILNEPHPGEELRNGEAHATADINAFYATVISAIREVDQETPIVLDGGNYASPDGFDQLVVSSDSLVLYSLHCYEPWDMTTLRANKGRYRYPEKIPGFESDSTRDSISGRAILEKILKPVIDWQKRNNIPSWRIYAAEFGCDRRILGVEKYLGDLVSIFNAQGWHWCFYSFREDTWDGMDYELGSKPLGAKYWEAVERGETPERKRFDNPIFDVLKRELGTSTKSGK